MALAADAPEEVVTLGWRLRDQGFGEDEDPPETRRVDAPPRGRLFQEHLAERPFWMLVACSLVNLTNWETAEPVHTALAARYTVEALAGLEPVDLHDLLRPLGLWNRRSESIVKLARAWLVAPPTTARDVLKLPGCGKYASDSWAIFMEGRRDVDPTDGKLNYYLQMNMGIFRGPVSETRSTPSPATPVQCSTLRRGSGLSGEAEEAGP